MYYKENIYFFEKDYDKLTNENQISDITNRGNQNINNINSNI